MSNFDAGYICGVLYSSGSIHYSKKDGNFYISLESKDLDFITLYKNRLEKITGKKTSFLKRKRSYRGLERYTFICNLWGKKIVDELIKKYGIDFSDMRPPEMVFKDNEFRVGFLQGFFDRNGIIRARLRVYKDGKKQKYRSIRLVSVNENILKQIKELLKIENIKSIIYKSGKISVLEIYGSNRIKEFIKKIGFGLEKKRLLAKSMLDPKRFDEIVNNSNV